MNLIKKFISSGDWHYGLSRSNRHDDITKQIDKAIDYIFEYGNQKNVDMFFIPGDLLDGHEISYNKMNQLFKKFKYHKIEKERVALIPGNHCLYKNTYSKLDFSAISFFMREYNYIHPEIAYWSHNQSIDDIPKDKRFVLIHEYCDHENYTKFLDLFPDTEYILIGDHHKHFKYRIGDQHLLNSGAIVRNKKDETDLNFFYVDTEIDLIESVPLFDNASDIFKLDDKDMDALSTDHDFIKNIHQLSLNSDNQYENFLEYMKLNMTVDNYKKFIEEI